MINSLLDITIYNITLLWFAIAVLALLAGAFWRMQKLRERTELESVRQTAQLNLQCDQLKTELQLAQSTESQQTAEKLATALSEAEDLNREVSKLRAQLASDGENYDNIIESLNTELDIARRNHEELQSNYNLAVAERDNLKTASSKKKSSRRRDYKTEIRNYLESNPGATKTQVARDLNIGSRNTVSNNWPSEPEPPVMQLSPMAAD